jgi:hypothetical protein
VHGVCCCYGLFAVFAAARTAAAAAWVDHVVAETAAEAIAAHVPNNTDNHQSKHLEDEEECLEDDVHLQHKFVLNATGKRNW